MTTPLFHCPRAAQPGSGGLPLTWIIVGGVGGGVVVIGILVLLCGVIIAGMWIAAKKIHDCSIMCIASVMCIAFTTVFTSIYSMHMLLI